MKIISAGLFLMIALAGCSPSPVESDLSAAAAATSNAKSLVEARHGFKTKLVPQGSAKDPVEPAPPTIFNTVHYPAPSGSFAAYLSPDPADGKKHPAIIWITGGDCNSIGDVWSPAPRDNDQSAAAYRKAGIVTMFPSLRGGNDNPGTKEGFLGEVDDVLAAADYLKKQSYVDPQRIYLGGHSTGGTLTMLVAESSNLFRGVFAFGPVEDVRGYGADSGFLPFDINNTKEAVLRSPMYWLSSIQSPIWVLEGTDGNTESLRAMAKVSTNAKAHFLEITGADHFNILAPTNELITKKIVADTGATTNITLTQNEVIENFSQGSSQRSG